MTRVKKVQLVILQISDSLGLSCLMQSSVMNEITVDRFSSRMRSSLIIHFHSFLKWCRHNEPVNGWFSTMQLFSSN